MMAPISASLTQALGEIDQRLLGEQPLEPGGRGNLGQLRLERLGRPHQAMLDQIADDRRQRQQQQRNGDGGDHLEAELAHHVEEAAAVDADGIGVGDEPAQAWRRARLPIGAENAIRIERRAGDDEPGIDLLALGDVAALERLVEPFLGRVFRAFGIVALRRPWSSLRNAARAALSTFSTEPRKTSPSSRRPPAGGSESRAGSRAECRRRTPASAASGATERRARD